jgi:hypothetical protein
MRDFFHTDVHLRVDGTFAVEDLPPKPIIILEQLLPLSGTLYNDRCCGFFSPEPRVSDPRVCPFFMPNRNKRQDYKCTTFQAHPNNNPPLNMHHHFQTAV